MIPATKEEEEEQLQIALLASANIGNRASSPPPPMMIGAMNHHFFGGNVPFPHPYYVAPQLQYQAQRHSFQESAVLSNVSFYNTQTGYYPANMTAASSLSEQHSSSTVILQQAIGYNTIHKVDGAENITVIEDKGIAGDAANILLQLSSFSGNHDQSNA